MDNTRFVGRIGGRAARPFPPVRVDASRSRERFRRASAGSIGSLREDDPFSGTLRDRLASDGRAAPRSGRRRFPRALARKGPSQRQALISARRVREPSGSTWTQVARPRREARRASHAGRGRQDRAHEQPGQWRRTGRPGTGCGNPASATRTLTKAAAMELAANAARITSRGSEMVVWPTGCLPPATISDIRASGITERVDHLSHLDATPAPSASPARAFRSRLIAEAARSRLDRRKSMTFMADDGEAPTHDPSTTPPAAERHGAAPRRSAHRPDRAGRDSRLAERGIALLRIPRSTGLVLHGAKDHAKVCGLTLIEGPVFFNYATKSRRPSARAGIIREGTACSAPPCTTMDVPNFSLAGSRSMAAPSPAVARVRGRSTPPSRG